MAYGGRFDGFHALPATDSKICLVRFDKGNRACISYLIDGSQQPWGKRQAEVSMSKPSRARQCSVIAALHRVERRFGADIEALMPSFRGELAAAEERLSRAPEQSAAKERRAGAPE